jgi:predicted DNA-binding transcriptional regulator
MVVAFKNEDIRKNLYKMLELVDCIQPDPENKTTDKEKKLLIEFLLLDPKQFGIYRFSRLAKEAVIENAMNDMGWKLTTRNIANKVLALLNKGLLKREVDRQVYVKNWLLKVATDIQEAHKSEEEYIIKFKLSNGSK